MIGRAEPGTVAKRVQGEDAHFDVHWSPLRVADRHDIATRVPAMAGFFELYAEEATGPAEGATEPAQVRAAPAEVATALAEGRLRIARFALEPAWYGGLRAAIRAGTDAEVATDVDRRALLARSRRCLYRYCRVDTRNDLFDVLHALAAVDATGIASASGRYVSVSVSQRGELELS